MDAHKYLISQGDRLHISVFCMAKVGRLKHFMRSRALKCESLEQLAWHFKCLPAASKGCTAGASWPSNRVARACP
jgi:hypothetical protein